MNLYESKKNTQGFTLLEVIIGLGITVMILGGVFSITAGSMDLSSRSNRLRLEEIRYTQFGQVLRNTFNQLPPQHEIEILPDSSLVISGAENAFRWPGLPADTDTVVIRLKGQSIDVAHFLGDAEVSNLSLINGVSQMAWEVFDSATQQWVGVWKDKPGNRASLIRLRYSLVEKEICDEVFRIPPVLPTDFKIPKKVNENKRIGK